MTIAALPVTPERMFQFAFGYAPTMMISAAIDHRVFDILDAGPATVADVSRETGASERGLRILMNGLIAVGLLAKDGDRYRLTPESSQFLVSTKPSYFGGLFKHTRGQLMAGWMRLTEVVQNGRAVIHLDEETDGSAFFEQFVESLFPMSYPSAQALGRDLGVALAEGPVAVLDIAAGSGVWGIALAQQSPRVEITAVDWPEVLPVTRRVAAKFGLADRLHTIEGNIREADFGHGYRIATLGHILHTEGEANSRRLLRKVYDALAPGGTVAIAEMVVNEDRTGPPHALIFAVNMLIHADEGDTYSFEEMGRWLEEIGFRNVRTLEVPGPSPLLLADKPA